MCDSIIITNTLLLCTGVNTHAQPKPKRYNGVKTENKEIETDREREREREEWGKPYRRPAVVGGRHGGRVLEELHLHVELEELAQRPLLVGLEHERGEEGVGVGVREREREDVAAGEG